MTCKSFPSASCVARFKAGMRFIHSVLSIFGRGVQRRKENWPAPVKPPHSGTFVPSWTPYRLKVATSLSNFSSDFIQTSVML